MRKLLFASFFALCSFTSALQAAALVIPNHSFENPVVPAGVQALPFMDAWQQMPQPAEYNTANGPWDQNKGVFPNSPQGQPGHLSNADQNQVAFLSSEPKNGIFQELTATYRPGYGYKLAAGIAGSFFVRLKPEGTLAIQLYYRGANNEFIPIAKATAYGTVSMESLVGHTVDIPAVRETDAWANKPIGIRILSTSTEATKGGFWDVDNVQLWEFAEIVSVPNFSFESPQVPQGVQALPFMDSWQQLPQPAGYNTANGPWDQLKGVFPNSPAGQMGHIENADGNQLAFFSSEPENGIYQELTAKYEPGAAYALTVGIASSFFVRLNEGASLSLALYYRDDSGVITPIRERTIIYNSQNFPSFARLADFSVGVVALANSVSANKNIGLLIRSTSTEATKGGFWDFDNVRLEVRTGDRLGATIEGANLRLSWKTIPGNTYSLQVSQDLIAWTDHVSFAGEATGAEIVRLVPLIEFGQAYFRLSSSPFFN